MECEWMTDGSCEGNVERRTMIYGFTLETVTTSVCLKHYLDHKNIIALNSVYGLGIEEILMMTYEERSARIEELKNGRNGT